MTRAQRREFTSALKKRGLTDGELWAALVASETSPNTTLLAENTPVKLNVEAITSDVNYYRKRQAYKDWVEANAGRLFTVMYDEKQDRHPHLVCLAEDETQPKWLFHVSDLIEVRDGADV